jgi:ribonuclease P protein component
MGLPRELRLRRHADFVRIAEQGKGRSNSLVVLRFAPNALSAPRYGFSVSKRIGSSVRRNRVKRLLREAVRKVGPRTGHDMVFIARPDAATASYETVEAAVADVLRRAGLFAQAPKQTDSLTDEGREGPAS